MTTFEKQNVQLTEQGASYIFGNIGQLNQYIYQRSVLDDEANCETEI